MQELNIIGWCKGFLKVSMTHILREHLRLGLKDAKRCADDVLAGKTVSFTLEDRAKAEALAKSLEEIGAVVEIEVI